MPRKTARSKNSWKDARDRKRDWKKTKLALIVLVVLAAILAASALIRFTKTLLSPWNISGIERSFLWDATYNLNLAVKARDISLVSYNPNEKELTILTLPDSVYLDVPYGLGKWQLRSIYALGETEGNRGGRLLKKSLSLFFGLPVDGFLELQGDLAQKDTFGIMEAFRQNPLKLIQSLKDAKSDLTLWEILNFQLHLLSVRFDKVKIIDLVRLNLLQVEKLADSEQVFVSDPVKLDSVLQEFTDTHILREHLSISIFNATKEPQLAQKAKRIITNMGGNVIAIANSQQGVKRSYVQGSESKTYQRLLQIFDSGCSMDPKCDKINSQSLGLASIRAQISLVLGEDYIKQ